MFRKLCYSMITTMLLVSPVLAEEVPQNALPVYNCDFQPSCEVAPGIYGAMGSPVKSKFNLSIGGYVKLDYAYNSIGLGPLTPAAGNGLPAGGTAAAKKDESIFTARQSRFWLKVVGPDFLGAKTGALIEADFLGFGGVNGAGDTGENEFGNLRMRLAYGTLDWANTQVLFGQQWDIFGPAAPSTVDFRTGGSQGAPANPRVPQIRVTQKFNLNPDNSIQLVLGVQNPVQDAAVAGSGSLSKTGGFGTVVNGAGQIRFISKALGVAPGYYGLPMNNLTLSVFGLAGSQKIVGNHAVDVYGYGAYAFVPLLKSSNGKSRTMTASLEAQAYVAAGMDVQGATAAATVGTAPNKTAAKGYGFYGQAMFYPTQDLGITAGYMRRNAINYASYSTGSELYNELIYTNVAYDLNAAVRVAAEYEHGKTQYKGVPSTGSNAGATSDFGQANIVRLAAYYFF